MNCPHCGKVVKLVKDSNAGETPAYVNSESVGEMLESVIEDHLEPGFEVEFYNQTKERFEQYGDRIRMSDKQMNVLRKLAAK